MSTHFHTNENNQSYGQNPCTGDFVAGVEADELDKRVE